MNKMGVTGYYNSIGGRVDDNNKGAKEDNVTGAIEDDIVGVIDDGVMGRFEGGDCMGAGDHRSIVALGSYNNVGTMLNNSNVEPTGMQHDNTDHPSSHVPGHSRYHRNLYRIRSLHTPGMLSVLFPCSLNYLVLH
jgi:hypothetical protein